MRVLLVRPPRIKQAITLSDFMFSEPLGLEMVYGAIKNISHVEILDMMIEKISLTEKLREYNPDIVGITSLCIDVNKVIDLTSESKGFNNGIQTIVGGTQAYLNPKAFFHESVDHIFQYTDENNLKEFISKMEVGDLSPINGILSRVNGHKSTGVRGRNRYLLPDRSSTSKYRKEYSYFGYKPAAIAEFGIGCQKTCDFCLRWRIEGVKEELIDLDLIKKDLAGIEEATIMFFDNDFFASQDKILTFINLAKELKLDKNYIVYGSVKGIIDHKDLIMELKALGLKAVLVGYESFKDEELKNYRKKSLVKDNYMASHILKELGIDAWASFMAHPDWDKEDFKEFRKYIKELGPEIASISPLTPFPNLPLYNTYKDRLLFNEEDYEKWSFGQVVIRPSKINLRSYYFELLKTNLYVNLFVNKKTEMLRHYGLKNIISFIVGGGKALNKYVKLMMKA